MDISHSQPPFEAMEPQATRHRDIGPARHEMTQTCFGVAAVGHRLKLLDAIALVRGDTNGHPRDLRQLMRPLGTLLSAGGP